LAGIRPQSPQETCPIAGQAPKEFEIMSSDTQAGRGNIFLVVLRVSVLAMAATMAGVLAHVAWRLVST
jgi:hypothetical protein